MFLLKRLANALELLNSNIVYQSIDIGMESVSAIFCLKVSVLIAKKCMVSVHHYMPHYTKTCLSLLFSGYVVFRKI